MCAKTQSAKEISCRFWRSEVSSLNSWISGVNVNYYQPVIPKKVSSLTDLYQTTVDKPELLRYFLNDVLRSVGFCCCSMVWIYLTIFILLPSSLSLNCLSGPMGGLVNASKPQCLVVFLYSIVLLYWLNCNGNLAS